MDLVRGFVGFVFGAIVVAALHFTGMLDGPSRWWSRHTGIGTAASEDDGHSRYAIHAIYQAQGGDGCEPQYEFHNLTNRNVTFATNWDDQPAAAPSANTAPVSMQPSNSGPPPDYRSQSDDQRNYSEQDDDDQDSGPRGNGDGASYDDTYPGGGEGSACNPGIIQIFVDRKK